MDGSSNDVAGADVRVIIYWRSGCPYCARLRWGLRRAKVATEEIDINAGNETVPTVLVGTATLVNPTPRQVRRELVHQREVPRALGRPGCPFG
jgi:glutaredoxin